MFGSYNYSPYFSVVIPLYNKECEIFDTVNSVLHQTFSNFEVIIVNDGSTDNSLGVIKKFTDKRIKIIEKNNAGVSSARNKGIFAAKGLYVALLDADDIWIPEYLSEMKILIEKFPECKIFGANYKISSFPIKKSKDESVKHLLVTNYFQIAKDIPFLTSSSVVINRECFENKMQFNECYTHGEDLDLWARLHKKYINIGYTENQMVYYNHSSNNRSALNPPNPKKHFAFYFNFEKEIEICEKKYYINQISALIWMYIKYFKIKYIFILIWKYKKYLLLILKTLFYIIFFSRYRRAIKTK
jgi:glycosyltransferase involved in cell wall biosynthesis